MWLGSLADIVLTLPRPAKRAAAVSVDVILCALAVWVAFYLRLDQWVALRGLQWFAVGLSVGLAIPIFVVAGLYRAIFRYSGAAALLTITQAAIVYGVLYATIITLIQINTIPRTVGLIQPVLLFLFVGTSRVLASWWLGGKYTRLLGGPERRPVMIYGAGSAGRQLLQALDSTEMRVVGFVDDDARLHGRLLMGKPIHPPGAIESLVAQYGLTDVLLAIPSATRKRRTEILDLIRPLQVAVRTIPGLTDVALGRVRISDVHVLDVDDVLGRVPVVPDQGLLEQNILGKIVLVTGAGGSIGSELCRQVLLRRPSTLLLLDISEAALYSIHHELELRLSGATDGARLVPLLGSVCDSDRLRSILDAWRPDTIYHAAAYKHVPLVEHNPSEGILNNVFGTLSLASAASELGIPNVVLISTDKAVRPTNVMGTTKRLAEQVLQAMAEVTGRTIFSMVRFGNVIDSSGSVVPLFRRQIEAGGPITITHPEITRYFMTIPEAAELVIQAGAMAKGGEVFVLDMGAPVKIIDLARKMVALSGLKLRESDGDEGDIELTVIGLRPGEKLYEELLIGNNPTATQHPRIMKAAEHHITWRDLQPRLRYLRSAIERGDVAAQLSLLRELVPEYTPEGQVLDWVQLQIAD